MSHTTLALLAFLITAALQRFWMEGHEHRRASRGVVTAAWTGYAMVFLHSLAYLGTIMEYLLRQQVTVLNPLISGIGLSLFLAGWFLRRWVIRTLGPYWSLQIEIRPDQPLIREGPYRFIRHPNYLALLLEVLGLPLVGNAYWTLGVVLFGYCPIIAVRVVYEEQALVATFQDVYRQYQRECGTLLPLLKKR